jgi:hypothetical protein
MNMKVEPKSRKILTLKIPLHLRPRPQKALPPSQIHHYFMQFYHYSNIFHHEPSFISCYG